MSDRGKLSLPPVAGLLPHEGGALLLSKVLSHEPSHTWCEAAPLLENQYHESGRLDAAVAVELTAQAAGVHLRMSLAGGERRESPAYLIRISEMSFFGGDYQKGETLRVKAAPEAQGAGVGRFSVEVHDSERLRAEGTILVLDPSLA